MIVVQYFTYMRTSSPATGRVPSPEAAGVAELGDRLPPTLELIAAAMTLAVTRGVAARVSPPAVPANARRRHPVPGHRRVSMPAFWLGLLLQFLFVGRFGLLPATGHFSDTLKYESPDRERDRLPDARHDPDRELGPHSPTGSSTWCCRP